MVTVWWSAAGLTHYSFLNPSESITSEKFAQQIDEMHWELQHLQPALVNRKGPILSDNTWLQMKNNHRLEVSVYLILCNNGKPFLDWMVTWDEKWILYDNQQWLTQWLDGEEAPKHFPKPNLHQKKFMVTVWWSAAHLIHYSSEPWRNHHIWEVCSANQWDAPKTAMPIARIS